jgi:hypothetical protein
MTNRPYYSIRTGKNPQKRVKLPTLLEMFISVYDEFAQKDYFQEAFGYYCVDNGDVPGRLGSNIDGFLVRKLRKTNLWPIPTKYTSYSEDDLFDIIEFLHDYVSQPTKGYYHSFSNCGYHFSEFDRAVGQAEWRSEINDILRDYGEGYSLSEQGEIVVLGPIGTETLLDAALPQYDPANVEVRVQAAIQQFRRSRSSMEERRDAVRNLGDVLEFLRPKLKEVMTQDESELFNILNNFGVRHHNTKQKTDYQQAIFMSWLFYHYLAAIHSAVRLIQERENSGG